RRGRRAARHRRRHVAGRCAYPRVARGTRSIERRASDVPQSTLAARRRRGGARHLAHGGQKPGGIGVSHLRWSQARRDGRARGGSHARGNRQAAPHRGTVAAGRPAVPQRRSHGVVDERFERYVTELFAAEDPILSKIRARHAAEQLPAINISPEEGKLLHVLLHAIQARRVLEIGALGGYSGVWLGRAMPAGGYLVTVGVGPQPSPGGRGAYGRVKLA